MTQVLSRQDLRNVIKIYINYDSDEIKELLNNPTKLNNSELVSSLINFKEIYNDPYLKLMEYYEKYMLYEGGKRRGSTRKKNSSSKKSSSKKSSSSSRKSSAKKKMAAMKAKSKKGMAAMKGFDPEKMEAMANLAGIDTEALKQQGMNMAKSQAMGMLQQQGLPIPGAPLMGQAPIANQMMGQAPMMNPIMGQAPVANQMMGQAPMVNPIMGQVPIANQMMGQQMNMSPRNMTPQNVPLNYNNNFSSVNNKCPVGNNPLVIPIILPPLPPLQKGGKKIYPIVKNQRAGHFYNAAMAQGSNYPGYEYLQKYMEHYDALKKEGKNINDTSKKVSKNKENEENKEKPRSKGLDVNEFKVPNELKLTLNLDSDTKKETKYKSIDSPHDDELKKIVKELEEQVANKLQNISKDTKSDLSSNLQNNIREEIKQELLRDMKDEVKKKISGYLATMVSAQTKDNITFAQPSIYQDTVPPFYNPGIVLP